MARESARQRMESQRAQERQEAAEEMQGMYAKQTELNLLRQELVRFYATGGRVDATRSPTQRRSLIATDGGAALGAKEGGATPGSPNSPPASRPARGSGGVGGDGHGAGDTSSALAGASRGQSISQYWVATQLVPSPSLPTLPFASSPRPSTSQCAAPRSLATQSAERATQLSLDSLRPSSRGSMAGPLRPSTAHTVSPALPDVPRHASEEAAAADVSSGAHRPGRPSNPGARLAADHAERPATSQAARAAPSQRARPNTSQAARATGLSDGRGDSRGGGRGDGSFAGRHGGRSVSAPRRSPRAGVAISLGGSPNKGLAAVHARQVKAAPPPPPIKSEAVKLDPELREQLLKFDEARPRSHPLYAAYVRGRPTLSAGLVLHRSSSSAAAPHAAQELSYLSSRMAGGRFTASLESSALAGSLSLPTVPLVHHVHGRLYH